MWLYHSTFGFVFQGWICVFLKKTCEMDTTAVKKQLTADEKLHRRRFAASLLTILPARGKCPPYADKERRYDFLAAAHKKSRLLLTDGGKKMFHVKQTCVSRETFWRKYFFLSIIQQFFKAQQRILIERAAGGLGTDHAGAVHGFALFQKGDELFGERRV